MLLEMILIVEEDDMPAPLTPSWRVHRRPSPRPDGQQRWDRAYLLLLQWIQPTPQAWPDQEKEEEEDSHDGRSVCTGLNPAPDPHAND
jgi:hypothetical protein